jgi:hypothetical protein
MRITNLFAVSVLVVSAISVFGQDVHYNYARGTNFSKYKTYQWVNIPGTAAKPPAMLPRGAAPTVDIPEGGPLSAVRDQASDDQLIAQEVHLAVDEQLAQKGLTRVETDGDLLITYHAAIHEEKSVDLFGSGWGGRGYGGWWDGTIQGQTSSIPVGTLVIDVYDTAAKRLIWRGDVSKTIDLKRDPNKNYKILEKAMAKLFKNYPPREK